MINHSGNNLSNNFDNYIILPSINKNNSNIVSNKYDIHYTPSQNEWTNSSYNYNKNIIKNLPAKDLTTYKLLSAYFNMRIKKSKVFFGSVGKNTDNNQYSDYIESFVHNQKSNVDNPLFNKQSLKNLNKKRIVKKNRFYAYGQYTSIFWKFFLFQKIYIILE